MRWPAMAFHAALPITQTMPAEVGEGRKKMTKEQMADIIDTLPDGARAFYLGASKKAMEAVLGYAPQTCLELLVAVRDNWQRIQQIAATEAAREVIQSEYDGAKYAACGDKFSSAAPWAWSRTGGRREMRAYAGLLRQPAR